MYNEDKAKFGRAIMSKRQDECMTVKELAEHLRITTTTLNHWQRGEYMPTNSPQRETVEAWYGKRLGEIVQDGECGPRLLEHERAMYRCYLAAAILRERARHMMTEKEFAEEIGTNRCNVEFWESCEHSISYNSDSIKWLESWFGMRIWEIRKLGRDILQV